MIHSLRKLLREPLQVMTGAAADVDEKNLPITIAVFLIPAVILKESLLDREILGPMPPKGPRDPHVGVEVARPFRVRVDVLEHGLVRVEGVLEGSVSAVCGTFVAVALEIFGHVGVDAVGVVEAVRYMELVDRLLFKLGWVGRYVDRQRY